MNTNNAAYWIALGVLALGLNSEYQHGRFVALHRVAERAGFELCRMATRAEQSLAVATGLMSRRGLPVDNLLASADRAEMRRAEIEQMRWRTRSQFGLARTADRRVTVVCPKTGARIAVSDGRDLVEGSPNIEVDDSD